MVSPAPYKAVLKDIFKLPDVAADTIVHEKIHYLGETLFISYSSLY